MGDGARAVHAAIPELLDDGEIALRWMLVIDVAGPDNVRYLAHRSGGGADGDDAPMVWEALGMMEAALVEARRQIEDITSDADEPDDGG